MLTCSIQLETGEAGLVFYHRDEEVPPAEEGKEAPKPNPAKAEFYAFTIRMNIPSKGQKEVRLWHQRKGEKRLIARAHVPLYSNQWYLPGIATHGDEIICYLDNYELFRVNEPLPVGGKFGMIVNTPEEIRLDDVTVKHFAGIKLDTIAGIRFNLLHSEGVVRQDGKHLRQADEKSATALQLENQALVARRTYAAVNPVCSRRQSARKATNGKSEWRPEWTSKDHQERNSQCQERRYGTLCADHDYPRQGSVEIEAFERKLTGDRPGKSFALMIDATEKGKLRCLRMDGLFTCISVARILSARMRFGLSAEAKPCLRR